MTPTNEPPQPEQTPRLVVRVDPEGGRYELLEDGTVVGIAEYAVVDGEAVMPHTVVAADHRGRGLGDVLVGEAVADLTRRGLSIRAQCWFVADYLRRHPREVATTPGDAAGGSLN